MTTRADATPLSIFDRYELVKTAIDMIDEAMESLVEEVTESDDTTSPKELHDEMEMMRSDAYVSMLSTMVNNQDEAKQIVRMLKFDTIEMRRGL